MKKLGLSHFLLLLKDLSFPPFFVILKEERLRDLEESPALRVRLYSIVQRFLTPYRNDRRVAESEEVPIMIVYWGLCNKAYWSN